MYPRFIVAPAVALAIAGLTSLPATADEPTYQDVETVLSTSETNQGQPIVYPRTGPAAVTAVIVTLMPGESTALHEHEVPLFAYLLEGELTVAYEGHGEKQYSAGDALVEAIGIPHVGTNSGDGPLRVLAVFMGAEGASNTLIEE